MLGSLSPRSSCWDIIHDSRALKGDGKDRYHANESSYLRVIDNETKKRHPFRRGDALKLLVYKSLLFCALRRK